MKKLKCAILGYGDRSYWYSQYAFDRPEELEVIAVIDVNSFKLSQAKARFNLTDDALYSSLDEFLAKDIECDFVINGTMDNIHYETTIKLLEKRYNVLLEKPVTGNPKELLKIEALAIKNDCKVVVCHVLRYTPFFKRVKQIIDSGEIGEIINIEMYEHVWHGHFVNAYVRGKWRNEEECGSGFLLAKCCHDTDLMCWLNNSTKPTQVASFGKRAFYCPENAPEGSTDYCYNCPKKDECMFDAGKFEAVMDCCPQYTWAGMDRDCRNIPMADKLEFLKTSEFGKCVYKTTMNIVDRQSVVVNFANGSTATLNMVGGASKAGRFMHIVCQYGEIYGYLEDNKFVYRKFNKDRVNVKYCGDEFMYSDHVIDINLDDMREQNASAGHSGGDFHIMKDLTALIRGEGASVSTTVISDSVNSHLICYAAEKSRTENVIVDLEKEYGKR